MKIFSNYDKILSHPNMGRRVVSCYDKKTDFALFPYIGCIAEELGHHYTSVGNILDITDIQNRKPEHQARLWAYNKRIGLRGLIRSFDNGCRSCHEIAEYLDVTEEFLSECIECYRNKYGIGTTLDNYYIMFIPNLSICKMI